MVKRCGIAVILLGLAALSCGNSGSSVSGNGPDDNLGDYVVLAWNDLGMHCLNPTYNQAVLLPPYNNLWAQVIRRGNPPEVVTAGLVVEYAIENNTFSYGKRAYSEFWDAAVPLFGDLFSITSLPHDIGLLGKGLSGQMDLHGDYFVAEGIPVTPVDDGDAWDPYQIALITVKDQQGKSLVTSRTTVPTSDEINCSRCHGSDPFLDILEEHDEHNSTDLSASMPVLCAQCHGSPALGQSGPGSSGQYLSKAIHGFHADKGPVCYDCHPGPQTLCSRSTRHNAADGNCITCHGDVAAVAESIPSTRLPWINEPQCVACHTNVSSVATGGVLYRNARGHGGLYCIACHGSPHAMVPSDEVADNYRILQYMGSQSKVKTLGSCGFCHNSSRGNESEIDDFAGTHGGTGPEHSTACNVCHTAVTYSPDHWPHAYQWTNSN